MRVLHLLSQDCELTIGTDSSEIISFDKTQLNSDSGIHDFLESIPSHDYSHLIISCDEGLEQIVINLICHIRLTPIFNILHCLPIIVFGKTQLSKIFILSHSTILLTESIEYHNEDDLDIEFITKFTIPFFLKKDVINKNSFRLNAIGKSKFIVNPPSGSSHQISNEWGAYRLAAVAGFINLLPLIERKNGIDKTLYFKFLKQKFKINPNYQATIEEFIINETGNVLLIDDNYNTGWEIVLSSILKDKNSTLELESFKGYQELETKEEEKFSEILNLIKTNDYRLIFLDLRLLKTEEKKEFDNTQIEKFSGARLLKLIKKEHPAISVIIFTASNKAWNMEQLSELGADGFYFKEHPDYSDNISTSIQNNENLKSSIEKCLEKNATLSWFWNVIVEIENAINSGESLIVEKEESQIGLRIIERIKMAYGLLKSDFEQSMFNKDMFHFSDLELSFITFWSCLNDIQYSFFHKTGTNNRPIWNLENNIISKFHKNETYNFFDTVPVEVDEEMKLKKMTCLKRNSVSSIVFEKCNPELPLFGNANLVPAGNITQNIGIQTAYLIYAIAELNNHNDNDRNHLLGVLAKFNKIRNKLYLTHGNEKDDSFSKTIEEKRQEGYVNANKINIEHNKLMLKIIYFLVVGKVLG